MKWKIYYTDGSTIDSDQTSPECIDMPYRRGVQVVAQTDKRVGWATQSGDDFYVWDDRGTGHRWWGVDKFGLHDYFLQAGWKCVLFGISTENDTFFELLDKARNDPFFREPKSGYRHEERRP